MGTLLFVACQELGVKDILCCVRLLDIGLRHEVPLVLILQLLHAVLLTLAPGGNLQ